jgi:hypothetical protein
VGARLTKDVVLMPEGQMSILPIRAIVSETIPGKVIATQHQDPRKK